MVGDFTRLNLDPRRRYSGVLWQQGRVLLDSDWNEQVAIVTRWLRMLALDTFGPVGVPLSTPEAFLIGLIGGASTDLSIGAGRLYVDGWLVEHFPSEDFTYLKQPFLPAPPALPDRGDSSVYLDVWQREVTSIEDPSLLDPALGGGDTTIRSQTVWQVKVQQREDDRCGTNVGAPPSAGRLWSDVAPAQAPDDPDAIPTPGGYVGAENRLYRIEIHDGGPLGSARFKWSRDNGSTVAAITDLRVSGQRTTITVARAGRDPMHGIHIGDWISVTDDHRELHEEPAEMAQVVGVEESNLRIILDRALPTCGGRAFGATPAELAARHARVQRWDQAAATSTIDGDGLIATQARPINLEDGIRIRFATDPPGGAFRHGDYWLFAARAADASIETLEGAPPRGVQHCYVPLAALSRLGEPDPLVSDCRPAPGPASSRAGRW